MDDRIRNQHHVGQSTRDWNAKHPSDIEGHAGTAAEISATVDQMDAAFVQFETGKREEAAAAREKDRLRRLMHDDLLVPIAAIARGNSSLDPGIARRFRVPNPKGDKTVYIGTAQTIMALAEEHKVVFIRDGMPATFTAELGSTLEAYAAAAVVANQNRQLHVQARAELNGSARKLMTLLKRMDGINRTRFRKEPHLLESWKAARNVAWPVSKPAAGKADTSAA